MAGDCPGIPGRALAAIDLFTGTASTIDLQGCMALGGGGTGMEEWSTVSHGHGRLLSGMVPGLAVCHSLAGMDRIVRWNGGD